MGNQVIYGDVLFVINFSMDFLVMFCTGKILHLRTRTLPLIFSSSVGALFSVASLFIKNNILVLFLNIAVSFLLCLIAYGRTGVRMFLKTVVIFYSVSMLLGGAMTVFYTVLNKLRHNHGINMDTNVALSEIPLWLFAVLGIVCILLSYISGKIFHAKQHEKEVDIKVKIGEHTSHYRCMVDTGNLLQEPITGTPVIVMEYAKMKGILPYELKRIYESDLPASGEDYSILAKVKFIPAKSVCQSALLIGFSADGVYIRDGKEYRERTAVIALSKDDGAFGDYDGILPSALL